MPARTGQIGKAVAEPIKFWWMILSLGQENHYSMYLTQYTDYIENKEQQI